MNNKKTVKNLLERPSVVKLIKELDRKKDIGVLKEPNYNFLLKLIKKADTEDEIINICTLGTDYYQTGLKFSPKLEHETDDIHYFKKNKNLSFKQNDLKNNKFVIGDNFHALKNLLITYRNKINVIYIDPPYGCNDMGEGAKEAYGNEHLSREDLLSSLKPRLELAKQLLSNDGIIFCSIDDMNQAYVKCLLDQIFLEKNFIMNINRVLPDGDNSWKISLNHEYCLFYKKNILPDFFVSAGNNEGDMKSRLTKTRNGKKSCIVFKKGTKADFLNKKIFSGIIGGKNEPIEIKGIMKFENGVLQNDVELIAEWSASGVVKKLNNNEIVYDNKGQKYKELRFDKNGKPYVVKYKTVGIFRSSQFWNDDSSFDNIFSDFNKNDRMKLFKNPKPVAFIKSLISLHPKKDSIVLDFYAGSGTTGHAVLELNKEDNGNRKFILCTNNENNIAYNVTYERCKRIMTGKSSNNSKFDWQKNAPLGGSLDVIEIKETSSSDPKSIDKIEETVYELEKFTNINKKIEWVCSNFDITTKELEE